jgi:hypothetical protein
MTLPLTGTPFCSRIDWPREVTVIVKADTWKPNTAVGSERKVDK